MGERIPKRVDGVVDGRGDGGLEGGKIRGSWSVGIVLFGHRLWGLNGVFYYYLFFCEQGQ